MVSLRISAKNPGFLWMHNLPFPIPPGTYGVDISQAVEELFAKGWGLEGVVFKVDCGFGGFAYFLKSKLMTRWWFQKFLIFTPIWGGFPI